MPHQAMESPAWMGSFTDNDHGPHRDTILWRDAVQCVNMFGPVSGQESTIVIISPSVGSVEHGVQALLERLADLVDEDVIQYPAVAAA